MGDHKGELTGELNPYIAQMDIAFLHESSETMQSQVKKRACAFIMSISGNAKFVIPITSMNCVWNLNNSCKDSRIRHCSECNCFVCSNCNCSVFHLDYQLAHWDDVELSRCIKCRMSQQKLKRRRKEKRKRRETSLTQLRKRRLTLSFWNASRRSLVCIIRIMTCWKFQGC